MASVQCLQATTLLRASGMTAPKVLYWWPYARSLKKVESIQESGQSNGGIITSSRGGGRKWPFQRKLLPPVLSAILHCTRSGRR
jgi:hypothetical protein